MYQFQQANKIENKCVDNTQYLRDCLLASGISARVEPRFAVWIDDDACGVVVHLIVAVGDRFLDPSYDVFRHKQVDYIKSFNEITEIAGMGKGLCKRDVIDSFVKLSKIADDINKGELCCTNGKYYLAQADYCEGKVKSVYFQ